MPRALVTLALEAGWPSAVTFVQIRSKCLPSGNGWSFVTDENFCAETIEGKPTCRNYWTSHYDYVCGESARGLQDLALKYSLALGYGILTVENQEQALARARRAEQDRGGHAARACLRMLELKRHFKLSSQ